MIFTVSFMVDIPYQLRNSTFIPNVLKVYNKRVLR